jgi:hypothetical protein
LKVAVRPRPQSRLSGAAKPGEKLWKALPRHALKLIQSMDKIAWIMEGKDKID